MGEEAQICDDETRGKTRSNIYKTRLFELLPSKKTVKPRATK